MLPAGSKGHRLFDLPAAVGDLVPIHPETQNDLSVATMILQKQIVERNAERSRDIFTEESEKLNKWAEDKIYAAEQELKFLKLKMRSSVSITR